MSKCKYCPRIFPDYSTVIRHQAHTPDCKRKCDADIRQTRARRQQHIDYQAVPEQSTQVEENFPSALDTNSDGDYDMEDICNQPTAPAHVVQQNDNPLNGADSYTPDCDDTEAREPRMVEVEDEDDAGQWWSREFPDERKAGATYGKANTQFENIRQEQIFQGAEILGPFADEEEWMLAKWLIKSVGHNKTEEFLKLPIVRRMHHLSKINLTLPYHRSKTE